MGCPSCGTENPAAARFCMGCGAALSAACAACGTANPTVARFCIQCGGQLESPPAGLQERPAAPPRSYIPKHLADKILAARGALAGERKQVTVLFADIAGSTELIQGLDPEDAQALLDGAVTRMMDAVHRYEGTVSRPLGDGIMALFGAPIAHEDHAVRACYAALAMHDAIRGYAEQVRRDHGIGLAIRVGLNSGEVVVRLISDDLHLDYTAIGQTVHLASRMEQTATPGGVVMTRDTLALVEGYVRVRPLGPASVKGVTEPVEVFELVGAGAIRTRLQAAAARGLTRFVGRRSELDALHAALEQAGAGHGQVVAMVGEPGVGKSRLVWELTHSHRAEGWTILEGSSVSYGKATSYLPVIDLLKAYCRIEPRDDARAVREKVTGKLLTLDEGLRPSVPAVLTLLDVAIEDEAWGALDPSQRRRQTLDAIKRLLLRESREAPLLVVFEDLHWIDSETQALLDSLVESLPTARMLLVVNYRPEYRHGWAGKMYYRQCRIDPLPPEGADELLDALLGDDPALEPLRRRLIERTEGNPFFLEESVRDLIETGALIGESASRRLAIDLASIRMPATVQSILAARIDRLPPEDKRLLHTAAVVGQDVPLALLRRIADLSESDLRAGLTRLQAAEFLYEAALSPDPEYTFKHALTHDVAYGALLQEQRRALHARIVEATEELYADRLPEQVERLAHHALRAEAWEKAVGYCRQAAQKAVARSANRQAAARYEEALSAVEHLPPTRPTLEQAIDLRVAARGPLVILGQHARTLEYLRQAEAIAERLGDQRRLVRVLGLALANRQLAGDHVGTLETGRRVLAAADRLEDPILWLHPTFFMARAHVALGQYREALELFGRNAAFLEGDLAYERFGMPAYPAANARGFMADCLAELGEFHSAQARVDDAIRIAEAVDHPYTLAIGLLSLGGICFRKGDRSRSIAALERSLDLCRTFDLMHVLPMVLARLGATYSLAGRTEDALPLLERASQTAAEGIVNEESLYVVWLAESHLAAGRVIDANRQAGRALDLASSRKERGRQAYALRALGEIAARSDPPDLVQAEATYRSSLALAEELGMRPLQAHCHLGLGALHRETGRVEPARTELTAAVELYRAMEMTFWLSRAEAELAAATASPATGPVG